MDTSSNLSHKEAEAFGSRALTDHSNEALQCPTRISPDMSIWHAQTIIQPDWLALLEGMSLACPATHVAVALGHCGKEGEESVMLYGPVSTMFIEEKLIDKEYLYHIKLI